MIPFFEHVKKFEYYQKQVMNPAVGAFGPQEVVGALIEICKTYSNLPLISVGCGIGLIESGANKNVSNLFYLVDPNPRSYYPKLDNFDEAVEICGMRTTHKSIKDLIEQHPGICNGNAILLLNWCDHGEKDTYDVEAIDLIAPKAILAIYETTGSAGSPAFHAFVEKTNLYHKKVIHELFSATPCAHRNIVMHWFTRESQEKCQRRVKKCQISHDKDNTTHNELLRNEEFRIIHEMSEFADNPQLVSETVGDRNKMAKIMADLEFFLSLHK